MKKLTILVATLNAVGHVNSCTGALAPLLCRGHRIIFLLEKAFCGTVAPFGFEEHLMAFPAAENELNPGENPANLLLEAKVIGNYSPIEKFANLVMMQQGDKWLNQFELYNEAIKEAIAQYKPDLIYFDDVTVHPAIHYSGIPWVMNMSTTPLYYLLSNEVPPGCSGLPFGDNQEETRQFNELRRKLFFTKKYGDRIEKMGYERYPNDQLFPESQALNVYAYPDELNYPYVRSLNWHNLEVFNKNELSKTVDLKKLLPEKFLNDSLDGNYSGKLIYLSLGSMGAIDLTLMTRLVCVLSKTNHKYIVSKGPRHSEYKLGTNMWGDRFLPQMKIIPHVDLVITHGGNNTTTETFAQGKPMLVLPLFGDQFDNAQRLQETGFGKRINPYEFTNNELIEAIESLLTDKVIYEKLRHAAKRIQATNRHKELADKIEKLVEYRI